MATFLNISAALDANLAAMVGLPAVAWPGKEYKIVNGTLYLRPTNLQGPTLPDTLGVAGEELTEGVYQVDVFAPVGEGKNLCITTADSIAEQFKPVKALVYDGVKVETLSASIGNMRTDNGWLQLNVDVRYRAFTTKR